MELERERERFDYSVGRPSPLRNAVAQPGVPRVGVREVVTMRSEAGRMARGGRVGVPLVGVRGTEVGGADRYVELQGE